MVKFNFPSFFLMKSKYLCSYLESLFLSWFSQLSIKWLWNYFLKRFFAKHVIESIYHLALIWCDFTILFIMTRKCPVRGYILGVLTHTTASAGAVWLGIWNSDHVVLRLSVRTSALPQQQRSHTGLRASQHAYFSFLTHTK